MNHKSRITNSIVITLVLLITFCGFQKTRAYDNKTTHPALTNEIVNYYNILHPKDKITDYQRKLMIQGSILEDTPPRWVNHFYDPMYKTGWTGRKAGDIPQKIIQEFTGIAVLPDGVISPVSSVRWVNNSALQDAYSQYEGDRTYKKALDYYADNNEDESYKTLGFVLHLLEDADVPAHTRDDTHIDVPIVNMVMKDYGSPYEKYATKWTINKIKELHISDNLVESGAVVPKYNRIEDYIINLAKYSNKYFFSKDTINDPKYKYPKIIREDDNFGYGIDENGKEFPLVKIRVMQSNMQKQHIKLYGIMNKPMYYPILDSYFAHLAPKAVLYGAGVIELFKRQREDAVVNKQFPQHVIRYNVPKFLAPRFSFIGELLRIGSKMKQVGSKILSFIPGRALLSYNSDLPNNGAGNTGSNSGPANNQAQDNLARTNKIQEPSPQNGRQTNGQANNKQQSQDEKAISDAPNNQGSNGNNNAGKTGGAPQNDIPKDVLNNLSKKLTDFSSNLDGFSANYNNADNGNNSNGKNPNQNNQLSNKTNQRINPARALVFKGGASPANSSPRSGNSTGGSSSEESGSAENNSQTAPSTANATSTTQTPTSTAATSQTPTSTLPVEPTSTQEYYGEANHIIISEVQISGEDAGDEFIELYNPTDSEIDLSSWSIQYLSGKATSTDKIYKKNFEDGNIIKPKGYFLIARRPNKDNKDGYRSGKEPDFTERTFSMSGSKSGASIFLVNDNKKIASKIDKNIVDYLAYGKNNAMFNGSSFAGVPDPGGSLERKAYSDNECVISQGSGEFFGNGCDTNSSINDFDIRNASNPQNTKSMIEPRDPPNIVDFKSTYSSPQEIKFSWGESTDSEGATSTNIYTIKDITNSSTKVIFNGSSALSYNYHTGEIGRRYDIKFSVEDRDGLSANATSSVFVPSFFDNVYLYKSPKEEDDKYIIDITTNTSTPFWDINDNSDKRNWHMIVFYLNKEAPRQQEITTSDFFKIEDDSAVKLSYDRCSGSKEDSKYLLLPYNNKSCRGGGTMSSAYNFHDIEDARIYIDSDMPMDNKMLSPDDYITIAFYNLSWSGGGQQRFALSAVDKTKYYFQESLPEYQEPTVPSNLSTNFDGLHSVVNFGWSSSTDKDTIDRFITYETTYASSTDSSASSSASLSADSANWKNVGNSLYAEIPVIFGNNYTFAVRAVDDFGNKSEAAEKEWSFPKGYSILPSQTDYGDNMGINDGSGQRIFIRNDVKISKIALWIAGGGGPYSGSQSYIEIRKDDNDKIGEIIASSSLVTINKNEGDMEKQYEFAEPVSLNANTHYWIVPQKGPSKTSNDTGIRGSKSNPYEDGYWSSKASVAHNKGFDIYFRLEKVE